jgi:phosphatidylglycerophosphatase C
MPAVSQHRRRRVRDPVGTRREVAGWATVLEGPQSKVVAAFDVDGTLTVRDCVVPFMRRVAGDVGFVLGLARQAHRVVPAVVHRDRDRLKAIACRSVFGGRPIAEIESLGAAFAREVEAGWLRSDTRARLGWHAASGHDVVLVSASLTPYLRPLAVALAVSHVIGTELAVGSDMRCTGELVGGNCRGPEKARRLTAWLGGRRPGVELWVYGDSAGDREMMAMADQAVWVRDVTITEAGAAA